MKIEIKSYTSPDIIDFKHFVPDDKKSFFFLLELEIGIVGKEGADLFSFEVCTPKWLLENHQPYDIVFGRHKLIVFEYDIENIINTISRYLNSTTFISWEDATSKIAKIAHWEYEDYNP